MNGCMMYVVCSTVGAHVVSDLPSFLSQAFLTCTMEEYLDLLKYSNAIYTFFPGNTSLNSY